MAAAERNPLLLRIVTGVALVALALAAVWVGGTAYTALVAAATLLMFGEWGVMHRMARLVMRAGLVILAGVILLMSFGRSAEAMLLLGFGAIIIGFFAASLGRSIPAGGVTARVDRAGGRAAAMGLLYCGLPALALLWLRGLSLGLAATVFVLVCVWATDIGAFFAGRAIGGARLAPSISPNKTWAGAVGGVIGAMVVAGGLAIAYLARVGGTGGIAFIGIAGALAVLSVLGDLFESWLKRRAGVKDSGSILPGHGGVMDRLDGLVPVAVAGAGVFAVTGWAG
ncbi:phosphatidate cytidylyltransferase [Polymorphobacter fuscus]|uniref:Phosphatidate cytidylyltransferase n=1 Tax=Sandarakinorhabdus fusca TaxID=1439888 RepID=A0A7C9GNV4_9SPHN|nr:phosphatidate cytidylyltransferase [Polymorphobacter fuscus]KAB7648959.1 phosphatidate cytidylyltransferase [Polymorphobacter fuscus]MQT16553.1 phosphatidate cytidylyltransferase [Polymorphobacter fuscus]NJC07156.1 phosphatidate cytidylyltransferase [Polymorphobacter fuscus]